MRPLMATFMHDALDGETKGTYDEARAVTVDRAGLPLVWRGADPTFTKVRHEPVDDHRIALETFTEVRDERTDDEEPFRLETFTRVTGEPTDDDRVRLETATAVRDEPTDDDRPILAYPVGDDLVTGVVAF